MGLLDFLLELKEVEKEDLEIIQHGDMFDLWQAKRNTNMIAEARDPQGFNPHEFLK